MQTVNVQEFLNKTEHWELMDFPKSQTARVKLAGYLLPLINPDPQKIVQVHTRGMKATDDDVRTGHRPDDVESWKWDNALYEIRKTLLGVGLTWERARAFVWIGPITEQENQNWFNAYSPAERLDLFAQLVPQAFSKWPSLKDLQVFYQRCFWSCGDGSNHSGTLSDSDAQDWVNDGNIKRSMSAAETMSDDSYLIAAPEDTARIR